jgi:hypothetical protein
MKRVIYALSLIALLANVALADINVTLQTSSCTPGIGQATIQGFYTDVTHGCQQNVSSTGFSTETIRCTQQYPAQMTIKKTNPNCFCVLSVTLANNATVATGCAQGAFTSNWKILHNQCFGNG